MYPRCDTCKYFKELGSYSYCTLASSSDGEPDVETSLITALDYEGYIANLQVHPTFGCVQHSDISDVQHIFKER